jgi:uncharacterized membrane protein YebE (DUF533 family)
MPGFDAKSLLEAIVAGNSQPAAPSQADLSSMLNHVLSSTQGATGQPVAAGAPGGGLSDILGQLTGGAGGAGGLGGALGQVLGGAGGTGAGGLGGMLGSILSGSGAGSGLGGALGQILSGGGVAPGQSGLPGNLGAAADIARSIFGNAASGVGAAASQINQQTGAGPQLDQIIRQLSGGQGGGDLVAKAQEIIKQNPGLAGALAGALGTMVVGTGTGRTIAAHAAKLGGLVLIGGLAYKAYQNYQAGQAAATSANPVPTPAPAGTGFEPQAQTNETATLYMRAMIAAASADGVVDEAELARITAGFQQAGHSAEAAAFIKQELAKPATVAELAAACTSPEIAMQCYTAARVAIEPHSDGEKKFLADLAAALGMDAALVQHVDAATSAAKV